ncbi:MAG: protein serine/threonine phosphatase 2C family protein [Oscillospiraceae bacterium]|nr:protein serine/threonine phosphatase 2C family protein [Oscillospiraceae bacterium]
MITVLTEKGPLKVCGEDAVFAAGQVFTEQTTELPLPDEGFVGVSDGVGGLPGGDAARFLAGNLADANAFPDDVPALRELLLGINCRLITEAAGTPGAKRAATLTGVLIGEKSFLFHAGNTRAWILQGGFLKQLTDDHTRRERLRQLGQTEAADSANPSELIGCFGGGDTHFASVLTVSLLPQWRTLFFTSDGIHDHLDEETMEEVLTSDLPDGEKCRVIADLARKNGSDDDITAVILHR